MFLNTSGKRLLCWVAAVASCLLIIDCVPLRSVGASTDSDDVAEEFWDQFIQQTYPGSTKSFTPLEKSALADFAKNRRQQKAVKQAGIGSAVGGGLLALLTPLLALKAHVNVGVADKSVEESVQPSQESVLPTKQSGKLGRMKQFLTPSKDVNWAKRGAKAAGVVGTAMLTAALALLVAAHLKEKKIKSDRRKYRTVIGRQRKEMEEANKSEGDEEGGGEEPAVEGYTNLSPSIPDIIAAIEAAAKPRGPLNTPPALP